jgi:hypothetical protein
VGPANSHGDTVRVQGKCVRLLPNQQILEVTHTIGCAEALSPPPSLYRAPNPPFPNAPSRAPSLEAAKLVAPRFGILVISEPIRL